MKVTSDERQRPRRAVCPIDDSHSGHNFIISGFILVLLSFTWFFEDAGELDAARAHVVGRVAGISYRVLTH